MSVTVIAYAVIGMLYESSSSDFTYEVIEKGCEHNVSKGAKFCPKCGAAREMSEEIGIDSYGLEEVAESVGLKCFNDSGHENFYIGLGVADGYYSSGPNSMELPDIGEIKGKLDKFLVAIREHKDLSKTTLAANFEAEMGEIRLYAVSYFS